MLKHKILNTIDIKTFPLTIADWDCEVFIKTLTGAERAELLSYWQQAEKTGNLGDLNAKLVVIGVVDSQGARVFTMDDVPALQAKNAEVLETIATAILEFNNLTPEALERKKKEVSADPHLIFELSLAAQLGLTLNELRNKTSSEEISFWNAYSQIRLLPFDRLEYILVSGLSVIANALGAKLKPEDLLPKQPPKPRDEKLNRKLFRLWAEGQRQK